MKRFLLLFAIVCGLLATLYAANANDDKNAKDNPLRKSKLFEPPTFNPDKSSYPMPFTEIGNAVTNPPISTGYYFVDSDDEAPDAWRPNPEILDTLTDPNLWRRILPGPRLRDPEFWATSTDGLRFFRNPGVPSSGDFFNSATDSTDNAFAGPIPIGFKFYFNGLGFDSFYVSTNGLIALSNDRYFYDNNKTKIIPPGANDCYNPHSTDWFMRGRTSTGMDDATADDWGYKYVACGGTPSNTTGGIRTPGGQLNQSTFSSNRSNIIAPFFGDMHLSQFNPTLNQPEDYGKVYFKRSNNADRLTIYFINIAPVNGLNTPYGGYTGNYNLRPGDQNYIAASGQVVLDKRDSSVTIVYERFDGVAVVSGRGVPANTVFRYNTVCGVHGFARHVNYGQSGGPTYPWAGEYEQYTHYFMKFADPQSTFPHNYLAIKFKQWKNTLRVVDIQYRVRKQDPNADLDFTEPVPTSQVNNYELLAGEERIGAVQPVAIIQNLTNNIQGPQGVNYQPQQLNFRARFRIINLASNRVVYNRLVPIDSACLALPDSSTQECTGDPYVKVRGSSVTVSNGNYSATPITPWPGTNKYNGIPPYGFVQVFFPPFEPNEFVNNHIGRLRAYIIADPTDPKTMEGLGDAWPFDDTTSVQLYVMKRLSDFSDDVTSYHVVERTPMPSTLKWVNIEAEVASGDDVSKYPLPPRGEYSATNNFDFSFQDPDYTKDKRQSPVIRMNRKLLDGSEPAKSPGGDQLRSFPIDLRGRYRSVLTLSMQRNVKKDDWPRGWGDQELVGPEPRVVVNGNPLRVWTNYSGSVSNTPDEIRVELMQPSPDGIRFITNVTDDKRWMNHPRRNGAKAVTNMSAYLLYGAGGYMLGFLETDKDSALAPPSGANYGGLRPDLYDDGIDYEYKKVFVAIPDTFIRAENEGAKNFRFRIRVNAKNDKKCLSCIPDDDDPFFVDNVKILFPSEITDVEMSLVKIQWPYTIAPASQAIKVPVKVKIANNTGVPAQPFRIKVKIYKTGDNKPVYCRTENLPFMTGGSTVEFPMPTWNARECGPGSYRLVGIILFGEPGKIDYDLEPLNDTTYTDIQLKFGDVFAYDPAQTPRNDVPDNSFTGIPGRGLNMFGFSEGSTSNIGAAPVPSYDEVTFGAGYVGGSGSGQVAMKFSLLQPDTVYGYQVFWGTLNQALDDISLAIYRDASQPTTVFPGSQVLKYRGYDDIRNDAFFDEYVTYNITKGPVVLPAGTYWMVVGQMGETGMELGASKTRVGMRTTSVYVTPPGDNSTYGQYVLGTAGYQLVIDKDFRRLNPNNQLINNNFFCYENTRGSGQWQQFMPTIGNPGYAHLDHFGISPSDNVTATCTRGTWIPMMRPYFRTRSYSTTLTYQECPDDITPVELMGFNGFSMHSGIQLYWQTASETNNEGFNVERKLSTNEDWKTIGFVKGAGNSRTTLNYSFVDKDVVANTTYMYRLRQIDRDGSLSCGTPSDVKTITFTGVQDLTIDQNTPNPFRESTAGNFFVPAEANVRLEILDLFGNVVRTLVDNTVSTGSHPYSWDGLDNSGRPVANGSYICRLTSGNDVRTIKMSLLK